MRDYEQPQKGITLLSCDIETTGLDPEKNQLIEFGVVTIKLADLLDGKLDEAKTFQRKVFHSCYNWDNIAFSMNKSLYGELEKLQNRYYNECFGVDEFADPSMLLKHVNEWCSQNNACSNECLNNQFYSFLEREKVQNAVFLGKNFNGFDLQFLKRLNSFYKIENVVSRRSIDPSPFFLKPKDNSIPSLQECLKRSGSTKEIEHLALSDAWDCLFAFKSGYSNLLNIN